VAAIQEHPIRPTFAVRQTGSYLSSLVMRKADASLSKAVVIVIFQEQMESGKFCLYQNIFQMEAKT
jgi:hypothetical protein